MAVVGSVGSGKSSLVAAMLGEMKKETGEVVVNVSDMVFYIPSVLIVGI